MAFTYDGAGNRVSKNVGTIDASNNITYTDKTTYIRDASGNILATYDDRQVGTLWAQSAEYPMYGSSRLGVYSQSIYDPLQAAGADDPSWLGSYRRVMRLKNYELSDHLGNVLSVITDLKRGIVDGSNNFKYYSADVQSATDYYPFGMQMPGRIYNGGEYRYGFNGQEKIDEIAGVGNHLDFKFRGYDPETGRFWSVDPLAKKFVFNSPYAFAENKLGLGKEYEGLELISPIFGANIEPMIEVVGESEVAGNVGKIGVDINKVGGDLDGGVTETQTGKGTGFSKEVLENFKRGLTTEKEQLVKNGLEKNNKPLPPQEVDGKPVTTKPDALKNGGKSTFEVKDVKGQSLTRQLKAQQKFSNGNGFRPELLINRGAKLSGPLKDAFDIQFYQAVPSLVTPSDNTRVKRPVQPIAKPCTTCI